MAVGARLRKAWNAFVNVPVPVNSQETFYVAGNPTYGGMSPSRPRLRFQSERSIVSSIYTRLSIDVAGVAMKHVKLDELGRYLEDMESNLNNCLLYEPNLDQGPRQFRQDIAATLFDKGVCAVVPVDTAQDPQTSEVLDIYSMRVGEVVTWYPKHVRVALYNEATGNREEILVEKRHVAIIENPLHNVMNEPNSTLQRLIRKLGMLDSVDEASSSGKLDLIIQLPYVIKSEARRQQAEQRKADIEMQLRGSTYGIAYTDGTEKITQLNRPTENQLLKQIEYLTNLLYDELGITKTVMDGTADEAAMLNYINRTVKPILDAIVEAMQRAFLGPVGVKRNERIRYYRDPFALVPIGQIAEIADKFTRNEIVTGNEFRGFIGIEPAADPKADELRNSNMPRSDTEIAPAVPEGPQFDVDGYTADMDKVMEETLGELEKKVEELTKQLAETE